MDDGVEALVGFVGSHGSSWALLSRSDRGKLRKKTIARDLPLSRKLPIKATILQLTFTPSQK
jgi:hypothetical protein